MKVVILCGGQGMRLREETEYKPKPMVKVGDFPILWHIMKMYSHYGFNDFVLCLGYQGDIIKNYFLNYEVMNNDLTVELGESSSVQIHRRSVRENWRVTLVDTGEYTQTAGRLRKAASYLDGERFMMTYGDGVGDIDVPALLAHHTEKKRIATLTGVRPRSRYGTVEISNDGEVIRFREKPQMHDVISAGFFVFEKDIFDYIPEEDCMLEEEPFNRLSEDGSFSVYLHPGYWQCMDTYRDFVYLNETWASGAPWKIW